MPAFSCQLTNLVEAVDHFQVSNSTLAVTDYTRLGTGTSANTVSGCLEVSTILFHMGGRRIIVMTRITH